MPKEDDQLAAVEAANYRRAMADARPPVEAVDEPDEPQAADDTDSAEGVAE